MSVQSTNTILMIRPFEFRKNEQTAVNNYYQNNNFNLSAGELSKKALIEFDAFAERLKTERINVHILQDTAIPSTPDAVFPNNWISFHQDKQYVLYPMFAENRRKERNPDILHSLKEQGLNYAMKLDLSPREIENKFLEGTGSLVLDRINKIAYVAISPRSNAKIVDEFCDKLQYKAVKFHAYQSVHNQRKEIYHTNVMMSIAKDLAIVCLDCIDDKNEKDHLRQAIENTGKKIIGISEKQVAQFAGNMLELRSSKPLDRNLMIMSSQAFHSLDQSQVKAIETFLKIVHSPLDVIEQLGGGSARCMIAELF